MAYAEKRGRGEYPWRVKFKRPDGKEDSASGFRTQQDALNYGREQEADIRRGRWRDPNMGAMTLDEYWDKWYPLQVAGWADATQDVKRSFYRNHLQPKWGTTPLNKIDPLDVKGFELELRTRVPGATNGIMLLLRTILADAVADQRLSASPVAPRRRGGGRPVGPAPRKGIVTTLEKVEAIRERLKPADALLVLVAVFTGMRWGEVSGMRRTFLHLAPAAGGRPASGYYVIDPDVGAVKARRRRAFGTTKTYLGRVVELPPFLAELLIAYVAEMPEGRDVLFATRTGRPIDSPSFNDRWWRPACDGRPAVAKRKGRKATEAWEPIEPGLWFHDLRRTHKTWLAEDGIEKVARDERLGHITEGMDGIYIQATPAMRAKVLKALQRRWEKVHPPEKRSPKRLPNEGSAGRSAA